VPAADDEWVDQDAGPVVRPYAVTGGRTRPSGEAFGLVTMVTAIRGVQVSLQDLEPEHLMLLQLCRLPTSVADLAADLDLPLGVVRILLSDMRERQLIAVHHPVPTRLNDPQLLRQVADGLRRLLPGPPRGSSTGRDQDPYRRRLRCG
jgi:hypothetical protein